MTIYLVFLPGIQYFQRTVQTTDEFKRRLNVAGEPSRLAEQQNLIKAAQATSIETEGKIRKALSYCNRWIPTAGYHMGLWFND